MKNTSINGSEWQKLRYHITISELKLIAALSEIQTSIERALIAWLSTILYGVARLIFYGRPRLDLRSLSLPTDHEFLMRKSHLYPMPIKIKELLIVLQYYVHYITRFLRWKGYPNFLGNKTIGQQCGFRIQQHSFSTYIY